MAIRLVDRGFEDELTVLLLLSSYRATIHTKSSQKVRFVHSSRVPCYILPMVMMRQRNCCYNNNEIPTITIVMTAL